MPRSIGAALLILVSATLPLGASLAQPPGGPPARPPGAPSAPPRDGDPLMELFDSNRDGVISADEIEAATATLKKLDADGDGGITSREVARQRPRDPRAARGPRGPQQRDPAFGPDAGAEGGPDFRPGMGPPGIRPGRGPGGDQGRGRGRTGGRGTQRDFERGDFRGPPPGARRRGGVPPGDAPPPFDPERPPLGEAPEEPGGRPEPRDGRFTNP